MGLKCHDATRAGTREMGSPATGQRRDDQDIIEALADALVADYLAARQPMVVSPAGHDHTCRPPHKSVYRCAGGDVKRPASTGSR